jgi:hypothetical protein
VAGWEQVLDAYLSVVDDVAPGVVEGLYVVGSVALGDWWPGSDIDIVAVTAEPADEETAERLRAAHDRCTSLLLGGTVDGPYVAWGDLSVPPMALTRPWVLHGGFHHDAECFELNPITWYVLERYAVARRGPRPSELTIATDRAERVAWVAENARTYWRDMLGELRGAVDELGSTGAQVPGEVAVWCLLGACRMLYTVTTGDVTSKTGAGRHALKVLPPSTHAALERCLELRGDRRAGIGAGELASVADAMALVLDVIERVAPR